MPKLTIFTATYNRGYIIHQLFESLKRQKENDFEWLVIDDGSTDGTKDLFEEWGKQELNFSLRYIYQSDNRGLIHSLNLGIQLAKGEYLSKIDSDDYVVDDYVETVLTWIQEIEEENNKYLYAVGGLRIDKNGNPLNGITPKFNNYVDASDLEREKYGINTDLSEVWSLEVLRKYPFPVWKGEKFAPEQIVFHQIALDGFMIRWRPIGLAVCEYQNDGLTKGASKLEKENPMGYAMMYNQHLKREDLSVSLRLKYSMNFVALCFVGGNSSYVFKCNDKISLLATFIAGYLLSYRRKYQYRRIV